MTKVLGMGNALVDIITQIDDDRILKDFGLPKGSMTLVENHRQYRWGSSSNGDGLSAIIDVRHPRFYTKMVFGGSIGAGEAYMEGLWSSDDLTTAIRIVMAFAFR